VTGERPHPWDEHADNEVPEPGILGDTELGVPSEDIVATSSENEHEPTEVNSYGDED
jgi:hypothetical protein